MPRFAYMIIVFPILIFFSCVTTKDSSQRPSFEERYDHLLQFPGGEFSREATESAAEYLLDSHPAVIHLAFEIPGGERIVMDRKARRGADSMLIMSDGVFQEEATYEGLGAFMDSYPEIFEVTVGFPDGSGSGRSYRDPLTERGGELTPDWLEGRFEEPKEPVEEKRTLPADAWYADPSLAVLLIEEDRFVARNREDGREKILCTFDADWRDRQENEGTVGLTLDFSDATGGEWERINMNVGLYEERSRNTGGWSEQEIGPEHMTVSIEDEVPPYPIGGFSLQEGKVTFINGKTISSVIPVGDKNNPFTVTRFQSEPASDWFSDEEQASLILEDGVIRAVSRDGERSKDLVKVVTTWKIGRDSRGGRQFFITFQDLTWGKVLGGAAQGSVKGWSFGPGWNILQFSYRFDGGAIEHGYYDYNQTGLPSVSYTILPGEGNVTRAEEALKLEEGTLAFADGHVLKVTVSGE